MNIRGETLFGLSPESSYSPWFLDAIGDKSNFFKLEVEEGILLYYFGGTITHDSLDVVVFPVCWGNYCAEFILSEPGVGEGDFSGSFFIGFLSGDNGSEGSLIGGIVDTGVGATACSDGGVLERRVPAGVSSSSSEGALSEPAESSMPKFKSSCEFRSSFLRSFRVNSRVVGFEGITGSGEVLLDS